MYYCLAHKGTDFRFYGEQSLELFLVALANSQLVTANIQLLPYVGISFFSSVMCVLELRLLSAVIYMSRGLSRSASLVHRADSWRDCMQS